MNDELLKVGSKIAAFRRMLIDGDRRNNMTASAMPVPYEPTIALYNLEK